MTCLFEYQIRRLLAHALWVLMVAVLLQLSRPVSVFAQVNCNSTKTVLLNSAIFTNGQGTSCFAVSIPRFSASVDMEFLGENSNKRYEVYWNDGSGYVLIASGLEANVRYVLKMPHTTKATEIVHMIAIKSSETILSKLEFLINAKDASGKLLYEKVGAFSGTATVTGNPGPPPGLTFHKIPAKRSKSVPFLAQCGSISIFAMGPEENFRINLYSPNNQLVQSIPIGQPVSNRFSLYYLISPTQVVNNTQWSLELVNQHDKEINALLRIMTSDGNCPTVVTQTSTDTLPQSPTVGKANTDNVNVRSGPGTNFSIVRRLAQGETVQIVGTSADQQWYQLSDGNWVSARFVSITGVATGQTQQITFQQGQSPSNTYNGAEDVTLEQNLMTIYQADVPVCYVDGDDPPGSNLDRVTLLKWDIYGIPKGSVVKAAWITLQVIDKTAHTYSLYPMRSDWFETQANWQQAKHEVYWHGLGALEDGDRVSTIVGSVGPAEVGKNLIRLNAQGIALIQGWVDGIAPNYGLQIADTIATDGVDFWCSEATEATFRPSLTIEYTEK